MKIRLDKLPTFGYVEIGQPILLKFATGKVVGEEFIPNSSFFQCTDFFNEFICSTLINKKLSIYGYSASPGDVDIDSSLYMLVQTNKDAFDLRALNSLEKANKIALTTAIAKDKIKDTDVTLIKMSKIYTYSPLFLHLASFVMRVSLLMAKDGKDFPVWNETGFKNLQMINKDYMFLKMLKPGLLSNLLKNRKSFYLNNEGSINQLKNTSVGAIHNYSGIKTVNTLVIGETSITSPIVQQGISSLM